MQTVTAYRFAKARSNLEFFMIQQARIVSRQLGFGYVDSQNAPNDFESLLQAFKKSQQTRQALPVFAGASENTIYPTCEGNWCFRFVHDIYHVLMGADFTVGGEKVVANRHIAEVEKTFGVDSIEARLIRADTIGQVEFYLEHNDFPKNQLAYVKDYAGIVVE